MFSSLRVAAASLGRPKASLAKQGVPDRSKENFINTIRIDCSGLILSPLLIGGIVCQAIPYAIQDRECVCIRVWFRIVIRQFENMVPKFLERSLEF